MPDWVYFGGGPSRKDVLEAFEAAQDNDTTGLAIPQGRFVTLDAKEPVPDPPERSLYADDIFAAGVGEDQETIQSILYEKSRLALEDSQPAAGLAKKNVETIPETESSQEHSSIDAISESQDSLGSLLPPPTQTQHGQRSRTNLTLNRTFEESVVNLPSWSFSLSAITSLNQLSQRNGERVSLLVLIHDLEPPVTIPLKKRSAKTGRLDAERAAMTITDETGTTLQIVMWDDYAMAWAGDYLEMGDVVYLERIVLSEYGGQCQGSTVQGSKVQICYRTQVLNRQRDSAFRPDLDLAWDQISKRVRSLSLLAG